MYKLRIYQILLIIMLSVFVGCGKVNTDNGDIVVIDSVPEDIVVPEEQIMEPEEEKYYDLGACESISAGDSCMMQPILQKPGENSVVVSWFTESAGENNQVVLYEDTTSNGPTREIPADTFKLSRIRGGKTEDSAYNPSINCEIYKHTAVVNGLPAYHGYLSERISYRVETDDNVSQIYTLAAVPQEGTPLKILLTSDHQIKNMVAANMTKVYETVGNVDAIFMNGDIVDVADSGYNWFYADNAFFRSMTGTAFDNIGGVEYYGAPLLQQAPIYTSIGNHDVMGVYSESMPLNDQFNNPKPISEAERKWEDLLSAGKVSKEEHDNYIRDNSFNTITYEEIFDLPQSSTGGEKYYATTFGDIRLITLEVARVWRLSNIGVAGKYSEIPGASLNQYGYGDFIFEPVDENSEQIEFLRTELNSNEYADADFRMVMFHSEAHSLGNNQTPAFCDPESDTVKSPVTGQDMVIYNYPIEKDYITNVIEPMLEAANTQLLFEAHSHIWNRFITKSGMNVLETSNIGNTYGAYTSDNGAIRNDCVPFAYRDGDSYSSIVNMWNRDYYLRTGDPNGLEPEKPSVCDTPDGSPYISSNNITVFSILDTQKGTVDSYYYDTNSPESEVVMFDSFYVN